MAWVNGGLPTEQRHYSGFRERRGQSDVPMCASRTTQVGASVLDPGSVLNPQERRAAEFPGEAKPGDPTPSRHDAPPCPTPADSISPAILRSPPAGSGVRYAAYLAANPKLTQAFSRPAPPGAPVATGRWRRRQP